MDEALSFLRGNVDDGEFGGWVAAPSVNHSIIALTDTRGRIQKVNDKFCEISGYSREELLGQPQSIVSSGLHSREFWDTMWRTIASGETWCGEICNRRKNGSLYWVESSISQVVDETGMRIGYVAIRTDVTKQKLSTVLVGAEHEALSAIAQGAGFREACEIILNQLANIDPGMAISVLELDDRDCLRHVAAYNLSSHYTSVIDGIAIGPGVGSCGAAAYNRELTIVEDIDTHPNWAAFKAFAKAEGMHACWSHPVTNNKGDVVATFAIYYPQRRGPTHYELELIQAAVPVMRIAYKVREERDILIRSKEEAETLAETRRLLIANLNHELRTPLNHIIGFSELLQMHDMDEESKSYVATIHSAGSALLGKVQKAIEIASSHKSVLKEEFDLVKFWLAEGQPMLAGLTENAHRNLAVNYGHDSIPVFFSRQNLEQSIHYLLENAVKYSSVGDSIRVSISSDKKHFALIEISDTGKGMSPETLERIRSPFEIEDANHTRKMDGFGLGLNAAEQLLMQSMGRLDIFSEAGVGTTIRIWLPLA